MSTDKLTDYSNDLLTYNRHFLSAVRKQKTSDKVTNTKVVDLLHDIDIALTNQISELENFDDLIDDDKLENFKKRIASAFGTIAGSIDSLREDPVSKILRDDYTALSMLASGYTMLHTAAKTQDMNELADFSKKSLERVAQLITETSRVIPFAVAEELSDESADVQSIAEASMEETQKAWNPENILQEA